MSPRIAQASRSDDAGLRRLLARNPIPGRIALTYERAPDYFHGCATMGPEWQVFVAKEAENDRQPIAVACRAVRRVFLNGREERLGYLGQMRVDHGHRGRFLVSRGMRVLREAHDRDPVPAYLASIIEDNRQATGLLVCRPRPHFPVFREVGQLVTLALTVSSRGRPSRTVSADIRRAQVADLPEIIAFLRAEGARRQLFPAWTKADFDPSGTTPGFQVEDFLVARCGATIVGLMGYWDQSAFKQTVVQAYGGWLRRARPFYNAVAPLLSRPRLPAPGQALRHGYASFVCVADDDPKVFRALLDQLMLVAAERSRDYLLLGLEARDPLFAEARCLPHIAYPSRLYLASWLGGIHPADQLDARLLHVEIATL